MQELPALRLDEIRQVEFTSADWKLLGLQGLLEGHLLRSDHYVVVDLAADKGPPGPAAPAAAAPAAAGGVAAAHPSPAAAGSMDGAVVMAQRGEAHEAQAGAAYQQVYFRPMGRSGLPPQRTALLREVMHALDGWISQEASGRAILWSIFLCTRDLRRLLLASQPEAPPSSDDELSCPACGNRIEAPWDPMERRRASFKAGAQQSKRADEGTGSAAALRSTADDRASAASKPAAGGRTSFTRSRTSGIRV